MKAYGLWNNGWYRRSDGEIIHSFSPHVMEAYRAAMIKYGEDPPQVMEFGPAGEPLPWNQQENETFAADLARLVSGQVNESLRR